MQRESLRSSIYKIIYVSLWMMFFLQLNDPGIVSTRPAGNMYAAYALALDPYYALVNQILISPLQSLAVMSGLYHPELTVSGGFPFITWQTWHAWMAPLGFGSFFTDKFMDGIINAWVPIATLVVFLISRLDRFIFEQIKNTVWNVIIEYGFQRKQTRRYAEALAEQEREMKQLSNQYRSLAHEAYSMKESVITDELTQVFNKRFFLSRLEQVFDEARTQQDFISLIMIDIDFFKRLNDTYGHLSGDTVLKNVAAVLKRCTPMGNFACRYGGEEFAIIMPRIASHQAIEVAKRIQDEVQALRFESIDPKLRVSVSQGICTMHFGNSRANAIQNYGEFLNLADQELYRSKANGRNQFSLHSEFARPD